MSVEYRTKQIDSPTVSGLLDKVEQKKHLLRENVEDYFG